MAIAAAMQQWNLHRRVALGIMHGIGTDPRRLLAASWSRPPASRFWITQHRHRGDDGADRHRPRGATQKRAPADGCAGTAWRSCWRSPTGSNLGGIATKISTAPNGQFSGFLERLGQPISFLQFAMVRLPFVLVMLPVAWAMLWRLGRRDGLTGSAGRPAPSSALGAMAGRKIVAGRSSWRRCWPDREPAAHPRARAGYFPGFRLRSAHLEGGAAILVALVLFCWPRRERRILEPRRSAPCRGRPCCSSAAAFAMAAGIQESGLSGYLGNCR
ncbi:MAG: hypothetical protein R2862_00760 [Thermoanaerobaculia bacterium]